MELQDTIATILRQYGNEVEALLATAARKKKLELSKELINSINTQVIKTGAVSAEMQLAFEDYGRYQDMKGLSFDKQPPVEAITK